MRIVKQIDHMLHFGRLAIDHIISQDHRKRLIANHRLGAQHGMPQTQRFSLANVDAAHILRHHGLHDLEQLGFTLCLQFGFQLIRLVEMIFNRALAATSDKDHFRDSGRNSFFHCVLDQRLVHDRHHFLRTGLGGRQETGAHPGDREHGFGDFLHFGFLEVIGRTE